MTPTAPAARLRHLWFSITPRTWLDLAVTVACTLGTWTVLDRQPVPLPSTHRIPPPTASTQTNPLPRQVRPTASYNIHASLNPSTHQVTATGTLTWTNRSESPQRSLFFHLYPNAFSGPNTIFMSGRGMGGRGTARLFSPGSLLIQKMTLREHGPQNLWTTAHVAPPATPGDQTDWEVPLKRPVKPGQTVHIDMRWVTTLPNIVERMGYAGSFHMVAQWFPKIAALGTDGTFAHFPFRHLAEFYADFGNYDVTITVPRGFSVAAVGHRVSTSSQGNLRSFRFKQSSVHDFAFAADAHFTELEDEVNGIRLHAFVPAGSESLARQELAVARFGLSYYGNQYGAYPYDDLTIIHPPPNAREAGGMEYPTLITTGSISTRWPFQRQTLRALTLHELGHQYFYGLVASNEAQWPFLDEGLTTYAETEAIRRINGPTPPFHLFGLSASLPALMRYSSLTRGTDDPIAQPADSFQDAYSYASLVYSRTTLLLLSLDRVYPGKIKQSIAQYARTFRFAHPTPDDLIQTVRLTAGNQIAHKLEVGLRHKGWTDSEVTSIVCKLNSTASRNYACHVDVLQRGSLTFPLELSVKFSDGHHHNYPVADLAGRQRISFTSVQPAVTAIVDPTFRVLLDEDLTNNGMTTSRPAFPWEQLFQGARAASWMSWLVNP